jgi:inorganic pyrophosphatase
MNVVNRLVIVVVVAMMPCAMLAQPPQAPTELPAVASAQLARSLHAAAPHKHHVWRDVPPVNPDGTINGYIEIPLGERRKYEFDMSANTRAIDRVIPEQIGGYPVNYGFVPQTVSYDGDPFDVLVLGPPLSGGELVRGAIVGLKHMEDEKGLDSKVVVSPIGRDEMTYELTAQVRDQIAGYFRRYKHEPGTFSNVPGWGSVADGRDYVRTTHAFFRECRKSAGTPCRVMAPGFVH